MLRYTGRDIGDEEIDLVFHDGDWQIMDGEPATDTTPGNTPFVQSILSVIGNGSKWEGTATDLAEAVGGETTPGWMTRRLKEHREELEQCGIAFIMIENHPASEALQLPGMGKMMSLLSCCHCTLKAPVLQAI